MNYAIYIDNKGYLDLPSDFSLTFHLKSTQFCLAMSNEIEDGEKLDGTSNFSSDYAQFEKDKAAYDKAYRAAH